ncbi:MAG: DUF1801 domain-containing protein [Planctomycetes bacterium]|nr:DUF1801 domain-containing protein [Planctomycetota bacterium]
MPKRQQEISSQDAELVLLEMLSDRSDDVVNTTLAARMAVLKAGHGCSELIHEIYCIANVFTFTGKMGQAFIHIATYSNHVNLGFNLGSQLDDPQGLLEGTGKLIRHVRLQSAADLKKSGIRKLIAAAVKQGNELAVVKGGIQPAVTIVNRSEST